MKTRGVSLLLAVFALEIGMGLAAAQSAKVTEAVNDVEHGSKASGKSSATVGTVVHDGEYLETGARSRAALLLPTTSVTRLGSNTIFNYSIESNTIDLQQGAILFCKPKDAPKLNITTAAISAGIVGTTGFLSIHADKAHQNTYILGLVEGHATAEAGGKNFEIGPGDILEFKPGFKPLTFAFDVPRFVNSSPLLTKFKGRLPNQSYIDRELASYRDDLSRGFIQPPSHAIDYSGDIPTLSTTAYDSAMNSQNQPQPKASPPSPPPPPPNSSY